MVSINESTCPKCKGELRYFDKVSRIVRSRYGVKNFVTIRRMRCTRCNAVHRELPSFIFPFKHYESEIVQGVIEGIITPDILGFEDYPCEITMAAWKSQNLQILLWKEYSLMENAF